MVLGYCPHPVTVYITGPIKGYIEPYYKYYAAVAEGGQYPRWYAKVDILKAQAGFFCVISVLVLDAYLKYLCSVLKSYGRLIILLKRLPWKLCPLLYNPRISLVYFLHLSLSLSLSSSCRKFDKLRSMYRVLDDPIYPNLGKHAV